MGMAKSLFGPLDVWISPRIAVSGGVAGGWMRANGVPGLDHVCYFSGPVQKLGTTAAALQT